MKFGNEDRRCNSLSLSGAPTGYPLPRPVDRKLASHVICGGTVAVCTARPLLAPIQEA